LPDEKSRVTTDPPTALEVAWINVDNISMPERAGIEHDKIGFSQIVFNAIKYAGNVGNLRDIGRIGPDTRECSRPDQGTQLRFISSDRANTHVLSREAFRQGPT
jgi:hypothetical protein